MVQDCIYEGPVMVSRRGMRHHALRFIDDRDITILIDDLEGISCGATDVPSTSGSLRTISSFLYLGACFVLSVERNVFLLDQAL